ncbi:MAG: hypothetical protein JWQ24_5448 [Tardiphaga sp.]|nr:hypothetical protein [Tardiphaga sp.]
MVAIGANALIMKGLGGSDRKVGEYHMDMRFGMDMAGPHCSHLIFRMGRTMRAACAASFRAGAKRLVHNRLDGTGAAAALRAAAKASIDLPRCARHLRTTAGVTDIVVGENVAGTNDHGRRYARRPGHPFDRKIAPLMQKENVPFEAIPNYAKLSSYIERI